MNALHISRHLSSVRYWSVESFPRIYYSATSTKSTRLISHQEYRPHEGVKPSPYLTQKLGKGWSAATNSQINKSITTTTTIPARVTGRPARLPRIQLADFQREIWQKPQHDITTSKSASRVDAAACCVRMQELEWVKVDTMGVKLWHVLATVLVMPSLS